MEKIMELDELRSKPAPYKETVPVRGFFRVNITNPHDDGTEEIVGDSGWVENQICDLGFNLYLVSTLGSLAGSLQVGWVALGTGTIPGAAATTLSGEVEKRQAVTAATSNTSKALNLVATFASSNSFVTTTVNISNIGLFGYSSKGSGQIFAGSSYASSSCAVNQNVNVSYVISFS